MSDIEERFKFRVWDSVTKSYGVNRARVSKFTSTGDLLPSEEYIAIHSMAGCIVEQCTGKKDQSGKLIYQGDICDYFHPDDPSGTHTKHIVIWGGDYPAFDLQPSLCDDSNFLQYATIEGELNIVGNIHENPESLKT